jgi:hypothetical protein
MLADGRRLHLHHGPIDLIVEAWGNGHEVVQAYGQAARRFEGILEELVAELPALRRPVTRVSRGEVTGPVARRMVEAARAHVRAAGDLFVTPMAAVAGAVAMEILEATTGGRRLQRAYVNNGGDIAVHLADGCRFEVGIVDRLDRPSIASTATIGASMPVRGIATSGQGGRSLSLGIADAVTVLAATAAMADVAATLIANAVTVDSPAVVRAPACTIDDSSDLGEIAVVAGVGPLTAIEIWEALDAGADRARAMVEDGLAEAAFLSLRGCHRIVGAPDRGVAFPVPGAGAEIRPGVAG